MLRTIIVVSPRYGLIFSFELPHAFEQERNLPLFSHVFSYSFFFFCFFMCSSTCICVFTSLCKRRSPTALFFSPIL